MSDSAAQSAPTVSVVIPTYKHRDFVRRTLESVWAQTFTDYEIIVVNDGSPDDTDAVLKPLAEAGRFRYIAQSNGGQASARNRGIAEARGEFIALLDDDDLWQPDKLQWQVDALRANPEAGVVYGRAVPIDDQDHETVPRGEDGTPLVLPWETPTGRVYEMFMRQNWIISPGQCLIRRTALDAISDPAPFDADPVLRGCDDWDLWCRIAESYPFLFVDRTALLYRFHSANASHDVLQMHRSTLRLFHKHLRRAKNEDRAMVQAAYEKALEWSANDLLVRAKADRLRGGEKDGAAADPQGALRKLQFLAQSQPAYRTKSSFVRFLLGTYLAVWRRKLVGQKTAVIADVS